jgi:hypothetical protein
MRKALNDWMSRSGDQGLVNEPEMIQRMWPGGVQPETAQPYILSRRETDVQSRRETMAIKPPMEVVIYVPTQGASIGYTTETASPRWPLHRSVRVDAGDPREGDPLWIQGKPGSADDVYAGSAEMKIRTVIVFAALIGATCLPVYVSAQQRAPAAERLADHGRRPEQRHGHLPPSAGQDAEPG